ncbi:MAG: alpha/beta hydrolase [Actinomycetota bacterium]|nr:alpha/beta hydrolase [Actinomycetota bacterium]
MRVLPSAVVLAVAAAVSVGTSAAALPGAAATSSIGAAVAQSQVDWRPCHDGFFCARVRVPLDYDRPNGQQISLALAKLPATDPAHRIGSLFLNPGGPGGSGVDFLLGAGPFLFTPQVRARFDLVGFDPRGIIRSTPLTCFATLDDALKVFQDFPYPNSHSELRQWIAGEHQLDAACGRRGGPILDHMTTADAARDLDRLRQAVGDAGLTYYGVSYGSFLGNVYANLFPDKVRALVIDGVLDPIAWTTGQGDGRSVPFSTRLHSAIGAQATLDEFLRLCDAGGPDNCAFAPHADRRYADLYGQLKRHPLPITNPDGTTTRYDESFLIANSLGFLYDSAGWPDFAQFLADLESQVSSSNAAALPTNLRPQTTAPYPNFVEGFPGVACSDSVNPPHYDAWVRAAAASLRSDGLFGPIWTWASSICADWPGHDSDRYLGPFTHRTAQPVLVVGNLFDPATPYQGAVTAARLLPSSRLLTVHGWGHTSLFRSTCADQVIGRYLLTSGTPAPGTVCEQDSVPFQQPTSAAAKKPATTGVPIRPHWSAG